MIYTKIAQVVLYNDDQQILLQHRTNDAPFSAGDWSFFGGHIEEGESKEDAADREILEELEYAIQNKVFIGQYGIDKSPEQIIEKNTFIEYYDKRQPLVLHEGQGMDWFTLEEARKVLQDWNLLALGEVEKYFRTLK